MEQINEFLDERIRACLSDVCLHCGRSLRQSRSTRDHVPSKALLHKPYPPNLPTVLACLECNNGFSRDEEYAVALLGCVVAGSSRTDEVRDGRARGILERNPRLRARIEAARRDQRHSCDPPVWAAESGRIDNVLTKNARGHLLFECGELRLDKPAHVGFSALVTLSECQRTSFESDAAGQVLPEMGSKLFVRSFGSPDVVDNWVIVQEDRYRFAVSVLRSGGFGVRIVLAEYLAAEVIWFGDAPTA